ncbi:MAG: RNA polymerase sigma factor [Aestuariibacter sp.]
MSIDATIHDTYIAARNGITKMVSRLVPPKEVEDIVQETYVRLCQLEQPKSISEPKSFLYRTAKNLALDHLKRAETRLSDEWDDSSEMELTGAQLADSTFEQASSSQQFSHFCEAVRQMPVQCRRVFVLKKVYGYSQKEISKMMNISESTVEKHIAQGAKRTMRYMSQFQDSPMANKSGSHVGGAS